MDVNQIYCGHHFTIYGSRVIVTYALSLHNAVCQLCINKTGKIIDKKKNEEDKEGRREGRKERKEINLYQTARTVLGAFTHLSSKLPACKV